MARPDHGVDEVVLSLGYLPDAFRAHFPERPRSATCGCATRSRTTRSAPPARSASRPSGHRRAVRRVQRRRAHRPRPRRARRVPRRARRGGHDRAHAGRATRRRSAWCPPATTARSSRSSRSPPRAQAPTNWINAGTYVLEPSVLDRIPARLTRVDRARDVPADARGAGAPLRDARATPTGSTSARPRSTCRRTPTCSRRARPAPRRRRPRDRAGHVGPGRRARSMPTRGSWRRCCSATARRRRGRAGARLGARSRRAWSAPARRASSRSVLHDRTPRSMRHRDRRDRSSGRVHGRRRRHRSPT